MIQFSPDDYRKSVKHYDETWRVLDHALYQLCRVNNDNTERDSVCAKLWIIGRTYATGIERKIATKGTQGSSMSQLAAQLLKHGKKVNDLMAELAEVGEPLTPLGLRVAASIHGRFGKLITPITRNGQSVRSFVSKYLHFHNPAMPIYDSVAANILPGLQRWTSDMQVFSIPANADNYYTWHLMRVFELYQRIAQTKLPLTVKYLDNYLLWMADSSESKIGEPTAKTPVAKTN